MNKVCAAIRIFFCILYFISNVIFIGIGFSVKLHAYDRMAAIAYSDIWWNTDLNNDQRHDNINIKQGFQYYQYYADLRTGGDCANFGSQVLMAGGIRFGAFGDGAGGTIILAEKLRKNLISKHGATEYNSLSNRIRVGDILFITSNDSDPYADHTLIARVVENNDVLVAAHTEDRSGTRDPEDRISYDYKLDTKVYLHIPDSPIVKQLSLKLNGIERYNAHQEPSQYSNNPVVDLNKTIAAGSLEIKVVFDTSMKTAFSPVVQFNTPYNTYEFTNGSWSQTNYPNDTWTAAADITSQMESGIYRLRIVAQGEDGSQLDRDENLESYEPGPDTLHAFTIDATPPEVRNAIISGSPAECPILNVESGSKIGFDILENSTPDVKYYITLDSPYGTPVLSSEYGTGVSAILDMGADGSYQRYISLYWNGMLSNGFWPSQGTHNLYIRASDNTTPPNMGQFVVCPFKIGYEDNDDDNIPDKYDSDDDNDGKDDEVDDTPYGEYDKQPHDYNENDPHCLLKAGNTISAIRQEGGGQVAIKNYPVSEWRQSLGKNSMSPGQSGYPMSQNAHVRLTAHCVGAYTKSVGIHLTDAEGKWLGPSLPVLGNVGISASAFCGETCVWNGSATLSWKADESVSYKADDQVKIIKKGKGTLNIEGGLLQKGIDPACITAMSYSVGGESSGKYSYCTASFDGINFANYFPQYVGKADQVSDPSGVGKGSLLIADTGNNRVQVYTSSGAWVKTVGSGLLNAPMGVTEDADGKYYVLESNRVVVLDNEGAYFNEFTGIIAARNLRIRNDKVYVSDSSGAKIKIFDKTGVLLTEIGGSELSHPGGIAVAENGNMYVANTGMNNVILYSPSGQIIKQFGSAGTGIGEFSAPEGIEVDKEGNIYVSDTGNNRVQIFNGNGVFQGLIGYSAADEYNLLNPRDLIIDSENHLWILDSGHNRALRYHFVEPFIYDPPTVKISAPSTDRVLLSNEMNNNVITVTGTVKATNMIGWKLYYGYGKSPATWNEFHQSVARVIEGKLADWDVTSLPAGVYSLKLVLTYGNVVNGVSTARTEESVMSGLIIPRWESLSDTFEEDSGNLFWHTDYPAIQGYPWDSYYVPWGNPVQWTKTADTSQAHSGSKYWNLKGQINSNVYFTSPLVSLPNDAPAGFKFWHRYSMYYGKSWVEISADNGKSWPKIYPVVGYPDTFGENYYRGACNEWQQEAYDLSAYRGKQVRIRFVTNYGANCRPDEYWSIDDVELGTGAAVNQADHVAGPVLEVAENVTKYGRTGWGTGSNEVSFRQRGNGYKNTLCWNVGYAGTSNEYLYTPRIQLYDDMDVSLQIKHRYKTEEGVDGGNIQISADNGAHWELLVPPDGYPSIPSALNEPGFSGVNISGINNFDVLNIPLNAYKGKTIVIRFHFASDAQNEPEAIYPRGWMIDDIYVADSRMIDTFDGRDRGWVPNNNTAEQFWSVVMDSAQAHSGQHCWKSTLTGTQGLMTELISPAINLSDASSAELKVWHAYSLKSNWSRGWIDFSLDNGVTWGRLRPTTGYPNGNYNGVFVGSRGWNQDTFDLTPFVNNVIRFAFRTAMNTDTKTANDYWLIDDVEVGAVWQDTMPPDTTVSASNVFENGGVAYAPGISTITLEAVDPVLHGVSSGVQLIQYAINEGTWTAYEQPFAIAQEGMCSIAYRSFDNAGNQENVQKYTLIIDTTPPKFTDIVATPVTLSSGTVKISFTCSEVLHGTPHVTVNGHIAVELSTGVYGYNVSDTDTQGWAQVSIVATDFAGNTSTCTVSDIFEIVIDTQPPQAITDLSVGSISPSEIMLVWTVPYDNGSSDVMPDGKYRLLFSTFVPADGASYTLIWATTTFSGSHERVYVNNLFAGATYHFKLAVADAYDNWSDWSNIVTIRTPLYVSKTLDAGASVVANRPVEVIIASTSSISVSALISSATIHGLILAGDIYEIIPQDLAFTQPAKVSVAYNTSSIIDPSLLVMYSWTGVEWSSGPVAYQKISVNPPHITGEIQTTCKFGLFISDILPPRTSINISGYTHSSGSTTYMIGGASVTFTAVDDMVLPGDNCGVGVQSTFFTIDEMSTYELSAGSTTAPLNGSHMYGYFSTDIAGHSEASHFVNVRVDAAPPISSVSIDGPYAYSGSTTFISSQTVIAIMSSDAGSGVKRTEYDNDNIGWETYTDTFTISALDGMHAISYRSIDNLNNTEAAKTFSYIVDSQAPLITIDPVVSPVNNSTQTISGTYADVYINTITVNGNPAIIDTSSGTFHVSLGMFEGANVITVEARDIIGNMTVSTSCIIIDTIAPDLAIPANITAEATGFLTSVMLGTATAYDHSRVYISNNAPPAFSLGMTTVTWTARDTAGNLSEANQIIDILDTIPPTLSVPEDMIIEAEGIQTKVYIGTATAVDIFPVTITHNGPSSYLIGVTTVTWTACDMNDNITTKNQIITVVHLTQPVLTIPPDITAEATGHETTVNIGTATATSVFPVIITNDAPEHFRMGITTVTWTATDSFNAKTTATQQIKVVDTIPPQITIQSPVGNSRYTTGISTLTVLFTVNDGDPQPTIHAILQNAAGTASTEVSNGQMVNLQTMAGGLWTLNISAIDWAGNTSSGTAGLFEIVCDTTPPVTTIAVSVRTLCLSASDDLSGVSQTLYRVNAGSWMNYVSQVTLISSATMIDYYSIDTAGNQEQIQHFIVTGDNTKPTITETYPANNGRLDIKQYGGVWIKFSEPVKCADWSANVIITETKNRLQKDFTFVYDSTACVLAITGSFKNNSFYTITLHNGITDSAQNSLDECVFSFKAMMNSKVGGTIEDENTGLTITVLPDALPCDGCFDIAVLTDVSLPQLPSPYEWYNDGKTAYQILFRDAVDRLVEDHPKQPLQVVFSLQDQGAALSPSAHKSDEQPISVKNMKVYQVGTARDAAQFSQRRAQGRSTAGSLVSDNIRKPLMMPRQSINEKRQELTAEISSFGIFNPAGFRAPGASLDDLSCYPNPFKPPQQSVTIQYYLTDIGTVSIAIYDLLGNLVKTWQLQSGSAGATAGINQLLWDGRNGQGDVVANGGYVVLVNTADRSKRFKLLVVK